MNLTLQPVFVASGEEGEGWLVFSDGWLVAILVRLSSLHGDEAGFWFLEKGFGPLDRPNTPSFSDLESAQAWMRERLADRPWPLQPPLSDAHPD